MIDLQVAGSGDMTSKLVPYSSEKNLQTIEAGLDAKKVSAPAQGVIETRASYPDSLTCTFE